MHDYDKYDLTNYRCKALINNEEREVLITGGPGAIKDARSDLITVLTRNALTGQYDGIATTIRTSQIISVQGANKILVKNAGIVVPSGGGIPMNQTQVHVFYREPYGDAPPGANNPNTSGCKPLEDVLDDGQTVLIIFKKLFNDGSYQPAIYVEYIDAELESEEISERMGNLAEAGYHLGIAINGKNILWRSMTKRDDGSFEVEEA